MYCVCVCVCVCHGIASHLCPSPTDSAMTAVVSHIPLWIGQVPNLSGRAMRPDQLVTIGSCARVACLNSIFVRVLLCYGMYDFFIKGASGHAIYLNNKNL